jgi:hypothetical protein
MPQSTHNQRKEHKGACLEGRKAKQKSEIPVLSSSALARALCVMTGWARATSIEFPENRTMSITYLEVHLPA